MQIGVDSHTCTAGAFGCFGTGVGSTEMVGVLATGEIWLRVPESMKITWEGKLGARVMAKDIFLRTIKDVGHAGATYQAMEFCGGAIRDLPIDERMCICNMTVEAGAKAGLIAADEKTEAYLKNIGNTKQYYMLSSDADASYKSQYSYKAEELAPQVACPHAVDNVHDVAELAGTEIQRVYIGSCTGGRLTDLVAAAEILKGKKIARYLNLLVSPSSKTIWEQAAKSGVLSTLSEAGATILARLPAEPAWATTPACWPPEKVACPQPTETLRDGWEARIPNYTWFLRRLRPLQQLRARLSILATADKEEF